MNTDRQLLQGTVVTAYDPTMNNILDTGDVVETVGEIVGSIRELLESFNGTPEEIEQLQEQNQQQESYVDELLADESIPQNVKDELEANYNAYNASSQNLIEEAVQGGPNPDGYDTANQIQAYNNLEKSIEKAEDEVFVGDAYTVLSTDVVYKEVLEKVKTIAEYLKESTELCREQGWGSYKGQGVFPYCLWKEAPIADAFYYSKVDIPFVAGLTDGLYGEVEGLVLLPKMFYDLSAGMQEFIYAYTWAKLKCTPNKVAMNQKRMGLLLEKLEKEQAETSIWSWVKEQWYTEQKELTEYEGKRCEDAERLRNEVDEFVDFVQERENLKQLIADVEEKLAGYWDTVNDNDNEARYHHGKIFIVVASSLVPVAGWVSKSVKVKKILQAMRNFTKGQWDEFFNKLDDGIKNISKIRVKKIDEVVDDLELQEISKTIKYLPGPKLPQKIAATFANKFYINRKIVNDEVFYKYHGVDNRTGKKYTWLTNRKYMTEESLREGLAIRKDWGVKLEKISEFKVPKGTWVSEGKAASQGIEYSGQDYQAVILNLPKAWIIRTDKAF
ncbi:hypothetical protein HME9304_01287 [Flagellimonas maritima]|uniref:Pre-toxin TG domain-containing protein n=1 Tax=Flagellimonas maritima TaxID=1383885 RepID=A0A2Z4LSP7_9FLAO|nr:hypothetical protein [Allomuricauda aurantiaca]AWX44287.1 hypothetical protein HME9304_01287 [Allomuricauda aurantiaca]